MSRRFFVIGFLFALAITLAALPALAAPPMQEPPLPPANDDFAGATVIPTFPYDSGLLPLTNATQDAGEPDTGCTYIPFESSVWFRFQPPEDGAYRIWFGPDGPQLLSVHRQLGSTVETLQLVTCMSGESMPQQDWYAVNFDALASDSYYIRVGATMGNSASPQDYRIRLEDADAPGVEFSVLGQPWTNAQLEFWAHPVGGVPTAYEWDFGDGSPVANSEWLQHGFAAAGFYTVRLTVAFDGGATATAERTLEVVNQPASITLEGPNWNEIPSGQQALFTAWTQGNIDWLVWDFGDGDTLEGPVDMYYTVSHIYYSSGTFPVTVVGWWQGEEVASASLNLTVTDPPPSSVWFEAWPSNPVVGQSVAFVPMSQGQVDSYEFNYGDGSPPVSGTWMDYFEHAFATAGEYLVQLTGYAGVAPVATFTSPLVVTEAPPAEVWFSYDPPSPTPCNVVSFWPSGTGVASYSFDYGDGAIQSGSPWDWFGHQYADSGSYEVTLYGLDDFGEQVASTLQSIQVNAGPSFSTWFWNYPEAPNRLQPVSFYSYLDPWGACVKSWSWDFGDGTTGSGSYAEHLYAADGTYHVVLTVEGYGGQSAQFEQDVTVKTIDVRISRFGVPKSATVGQQRTIVVGITNRTYPVGVAVVLYKRGAFGEEFVGELHQLVRVQNRATEFAFNYTFTPQDAELGKVTFVARAYLESPYYDALPLDNEAVSLAVTVLKGKPAQATTADLEMLETFEFAEPLRFLYLPVIQE